MRCVVWSTRPVGRGASRRHLTALHRGQVTPIPQSGSVCGAAATCGDCSVLADCGYCFPDAALGGTPGEGLCLPGTTSGPTGAAAAMCNATVMMSCMCGVGGRALRLRAADMWPWFNGAICSATLVDSQRMPAVVFFLACAGGSYFVSSVFCGGRGRMGVR